MNMHASGYLVNVTFGLHCIDYLLNQLWCIWSYNMKAQYFHAMLFYHNLSKAFMLLTGIALGMIGFALLKIAKG